MKRMGQYAEIKPILTEENKAEIGELF